MSISNLIYKLCRQYGALYQAIHAKLCEKSQAGYYRSKVKKSTGSLPRKTRFMIPKYFCKLLQRTQTCDIYIYIFLNQK